MKTKIILSILAVLTAALIFTACGEDGSMGLSGPPGKTGPAGPDGVAITGLYASPAVIRPGESTDLTVSAGASSGSSLAYSWTAASGVLSASDTNPVTWTAPDTVGTYLVQVDVTNSASISSTAYATVLVSVSPSGPIVTSVSPSSARAGDSVTITGAGFGSTQGASALTIGGAAATDIASWSEHTIVANVPEGAGTGAVTVTAGGAQSSPGYLVVLWSTYDPENTAISTDSYMQQFPRITTDGAGGAIITWIDNRSGNYDIYAQRVDSAGTPVWTADGVPISTAADIQFEPEITTDGSGGAIITWRDRRNETPYDIYAQRVDAAGTPVWIANGVAISTATGIQSYLRITTDGSGGAIIAWIDARSGNADIYAQRVNSAGTPVWTADGVAISTAAEIQVYPAITTDGSGGAIITWTDARSGNTDIYAQRVDSAGTPVWTADGVAISATTGSQAKPQITVDGAGGAIITWADTRSGNTDIYAQRVDSAGAPVWTADGVVISAATGDQTNVQLAVDGAGGAIITWDDWRSGSDIDIYAQRVDFYGEARWTADGVIISAATGNQVKAQITTDGAGGAIITWDDWRSGSDINIYAQRVDFYGEARWTADGVVISSIAGFQQSPQITTNGMGGAIITWDDGRGVSADIYAQGVDADGK